MTQFIFTKKWLFNSTFTLFIILFCNTVYAQQCECYIGETINTLDTSDNYSYVFDFGNGVTGIGYCLDFNTTGPGIAGLEFTVVDYNPTNASIEALTACATSGCASNEIEHCLWSHTNSDIGFINPGCNGNTDECVLFLVPTDPQFQPIIVPISNLSDPTVCTNSTTSIDPCEDVAVVVNANSTCEGGTINFSATDGFETYAWIGPNGFSSSMQNLLIEEAIAANHNGEYTLTVSTPEGCTASTSITVNVQVPMPPEPLCEGQVIEATAPSGYSAYQWYKDGIAIADATDAVYTITEIGEYNVTVNNGILDDDCTDQMCCPFIVIEGNCAPACPPVGCTPITITKLN